MGNGTLTNAPLKEVLFEIHWEVEELPDQKIRVDNGFENAVSKFTQSCSNNDFKECLVLKPELIPSSAFIHRVTHRFFKVKNEHPLYQMGPGVFTVNDNNKNYQWSDFSKMILSGLSCLKDSYDKVLVLSQVQLRYIDRVSPTVLGDSDKFEFLKNHLKIKAESYDFVEGELEEISFGKSFRINEDIHLNLTISTGIDRLTKEDIIEWHTFVTNDSRVALDDIEKWIERAHTLCSDTFKKMISSELHEYFNN